MFDVKPEDLLKQVLVIISSTFLEKEFGLTRHEPIQKCHQFKVLNNKHNIRNHHVKNKLKRGQRTTTCVKTQTFKRAKQSK